MKVGTIIYSVNTRRKDMNEWKELKIDDLPRSIFKDNLYDFKIKTIRKERNKNCGYDESWDDHDIDIDVYGVLKAITEEKPNLKGFYRKRQEKQPSNCIDVLPYIDERLKLIGLEESDKTISWWKGYQEAFISIRDYVIGNTIPPEAE